MNTTSSTPARPHDQALSAAQERAFDAYAKILRVLGNGTHHLSFAAQTVAGDYVVQKVTVTLRVGDGVELACRPADFTALQVALTVALEGSTVRGAVLIAHSERAGAAGRHLVACGWRLRDGWLHGLDIADLAVSVRPCRGGDAPPTVVRPAPELPAPAVE
ncbi:hypothetical protein V2W30_41395 (plasmid) [Streptomyces sp. Q6]|uniref:Uncharacterized protein n=1 Tax=Streptomyces citrinus TaxID=3118173 RepID=A0ACD5ARS3_9ACTN